MCSSFGISLVIIPFWWNNTIESLAATINKKRPDIELVNRSIPIPDEMPMQRPSKGKTDSFNR